HHDEAAPRGVILSVGLEVSGQVTDALAQQRDLHFRGTRVLGMLPELLDDAYFGLAQLNVLLNRHTLLYVCLFRISKS
ncbi:MAG TPA: hypothetical protein VJN69_13500, partial [Candidatus Acidoferrales bacterium]|nr:hypothetical protein [Candidatus Acidoferrales bacterium]